MKWIAKQQNPKFWKMLVLAWWCWNLTDIIRELALIYLSTSIHLYLYLQIFIYIYIYIYICVHLLFAWNQLQWHTLRTSLFWAFISLSLSLSNTYPSNGFCNKKSKFGKMIVLGWWPWNLVNIARELALIYPSISTHLLIYMRTSLVCMESAAVTHT